MGLVGREGAVAAVAIGLIGLTDPAILAAKVLQGGQVGPHAVGVDGTVEGDGWKAWAGCREQGFIALGFIVEYHRLVDLAGIERLSKIDDGLSEGSWRRIAICGHTGCRPQQRLVNAATDVCRVDGLAYAAAHRGATIGVGSVNIHYAISRQACLHSFLVLICL